MGGTGHQFFWHFPIGHSLGKVTGVPQASHDIPFALTLSWCGELYPCQVEPGKSCFKCLRSSGLTAECSPCQVHISPWVGGKSGFCLSPLCGLGWTAGQLGHISQRLLLIYVICLFILLKKVPQNTSKKVMPFAVCHMWYNQACLFSVLIITAKL